MGRSRARRKKKNGISGVLFKLCLFLVFLVVAFFAFGDKVFDRWIPEKERKDLNEWFEVSGDEVMVYLNGQPEFESKGVLYGDEVYLSMNYVAGKLNGRFFYSGADDMISYTLADETVDYKAGDRIGGKEVFRKFGDGLYLSLSAVEAYTNIMDESFCGGDEDANRVFIYQGGSVIEKVEFDKKTKLRTERSIKSPILDDIEKGDTAYVTDTNAEWSKVITGNGISGFVETKTLGEFSEYRFPDSYAEEKINYTLQDEKVVMAWHGVYGNAGNASFDDYYEVTGGAINVIAPTWIQISDENGAYVNYTSTDYIKKAHEKGLKVWPVVDNFNQPGGLKDFSTKEYFAAAANRRDFISRLIDDALKYGYDGLNLDFEGIAADAGESFAQFFRELSVECRKNGLVLSIDNYVPYDFNDYYRIDEQGVFADYVVIMAYDEHTSTAGSVASANYTEYGISETLLDVPAGRIIGGMPLYTRLWTVEGDKVSSETMGISKAAEFIEKNGIGLEWDEVLGQYYGEMKQGNAWKKIWLEDANSLQVKMNIMKKYDVGGIALWRLGYEPASIWKELDYAGRLN